MTLARSNDISISKHEPETKVLMLLKPIFGESVVAANKISKRNITGQDEQAVKTTRIPPEFFRLISLFLVLIC